MVEIFFLSPHPRRKLHLDYEWINPLAIYIRTWVSLYLELIKTQYPNEDFIATVCPTVGLSQWCVACLRAKEIKYNLILPCIDMDDVWSIPCREAHKEIVENANTITYIEENEYQEESKKNIPLAYREIKKRIIESEKAILFAFSNANSPRIKSFIKKARLTGRVKVYELELEVGDKKQWKKKIKLEKCTQKRIRLLKRM